MLSLRTPAYGGIDCDFGFDSQEWSCSEVTIWVGLDVSASVSKPPYGRSLRRQHTAFFTVKLTLIFKSGAALTGLFSRTIVGVVLFFVGMVISCSIWPFLVHDRRFVVGVVLFFVGMVINIHADYTLLSLRKPGETGYKIPTGGMFTYVSGE